MAPVITKPNSISTDIHSALTVMDLQLRFSEHSDKILSVSDERKQKPAKYEEKDNEEEERKTKRYTLLYLIIKIKLLLYIYYKEILFSIFPKSTFSIFAIKNFEFHSKIKTDQ